MRTAPRRQPAAEPDAGHRRPRRRAPAPARLARRPAGDRPDGAGEAIDLGSGGGLPGLPLAMARPECALDAGRLGRQEGTILAEFVDELSLPNVTVIADRAEALGRSPAHRERYDLVTARACAALRCWSSSRSRCWRSAAAGGLEGPPFRGGRRGAAGPGRRSASSAAAGSGSSSPGARRSAGTGS